MNTTRPQGTFHSPHQPARTQLLVQLDHDDLVAKSFKKIDGVHGQQELLHAALGLAGEVGELIDSIKKHVFYEQPLDLENCIEELGDIEYYLGALRRNLHIGRLRTLESNITKLEKRYPGRKFTTAAAFERADKQATSHAAHSAEQAEFLMSTMQEREQMKGGAL